MKFFARHPKDSSKLPSNERGIDRSSAGSATLTDDMSDEDLALAAASGGREAFAMLIERHYERIHRLAWRLTGSRPDAEDVAQEVCVKLATAIRSFRGEAAFSTWIWRIAHNAATDFLRQRQRMMPTEASELMTLVDASGQTLEPVESGEDGLWAAVRRLSGQQREAVTLVYGEDMSHAEAAVVMGCSEKTVSWHLHEARKRLKSILETAG
jgi:RNA polymerase sigma-70 factor (ECF subfamily)